MRASKLLVDSLLPATTRWDLFHLQCLVYMLLGVFCFFLLLSLLLFWIQRVQLEAEAALHNVRTGAHMAWVSSHLVLIDTRHKRDLKSRSRGWSRRSHSESQNHVGTRFK